MSTQCPISSDRLDAAIDLLTSYDPNYHRAEDVVRSIVETMVGLLDPCRVENEQPLLSVVVPVSAKQQECPA